MFLRPFLRALVASTLVLAPAARANSLDQSEIDGIANLVRLGRHIEAQSLLAGRVPHIALGEKGTRYTRALTFLPLARATGDRAMIRTILTVLEEDGYALADRAKRVYGPASRVKCLTDAVTCFSALSITDAQVHYRRGWCRHELGDLAAARADLADAVALDEGHDEARWLLARTQWRLGNRRPAVELVVGGLKRAPSREGSELLASMLRYSKRKGRSGKARALAERWAAALDEDAASPLHGLVSEIKLEGEDLPGAMDSFARTLPEDRPWLLGGIVRTARAQAAQGEEGRAGVVAAIGRLPLEHTAMPAPLLKLSGDIAMTRNDAGLALRHYAAAVTAGEREAAEMAHHARARAGTPLEPGAMAALLSGHEFAYAPHGEDPLKQTSPFAGGLLLFDGKPLDDLDDKVTRSVVALLSRGSAAARAHNAAEIMRRPGLPRKVALDLAVAQATPVPSRAAMVRRYLDGDVKGTREALDAFSLVSWQVLQPGVVGMLRAAPPGSGATNVAPVKEPDSRPPALEAVGQALAALKDPNVGEEARLAALMEVAGHRTPQTERLGDPVVIDLDGNGRIDITSRQSSEGSAFFDLDGWGERRQVQWIQAGGDGWLCEDVNRDGQISSGTELFGTAGGYTDGFEKLSLRDRNGDGRVAGAELAGLSVWRETVNPGAVDPGELVCVEEAGVESVTIPRVGLRTVATVRGQVRLCVEVWPEAVNWSGPMAAGDGLDLDGL